MGQSTDPTAPPAFTALGAVLSVRDIAKASRFYQRVLGFEQRFTLSRADGELTLAVLGFGASSLLLGRLDELHYEHAARARKIRRGPHGLGITMTLLVPDLDRVHEAARKVRAEILLKPSEEFYGDRVFMFLDPDGYEWKVSQTLRQVSVDDVKEIVSRI